MKKKILSLALVVAMLASMLVFVPVSGAEEQPTVAFTDATGVVGGQVTVQVVITADAFVNGYTFAYEYDATKLGAPKISHLLGKEDDITFLSTNSLKDSKDYTSLQNGPIDAFTGTLDLSSKVFEDFDAMGYEANDGLVVATLTFDVLAAGTTTVEFRNLSGYSTKGVFFEYNEILGDGAEWRGSDINYVNANLTLLPEGYVDAAPNDEADFTIADGVLTKYKGASTTASLPADVTDIAQGAFSRSSVNMIIIPETVEYIEQKAISEPARNVTTHVYIFSADTECDPDAFYTTAEKRCGSIVVHAPAGSSAEKVVEADTTGKITFEELNLCTITAGGAKYLISAGAKTTVPGVTTTADGKIAVAWKKGDTTYAPGAAITVDGNLDLEPVTITAPAMNAGAGLKVADKIENCKMRFTTDMAIADYEALASLGTVTMGTIITPAKYVSLAGGLTKEALNALSAENGGVQTYIDVVANGYFEKTETTYTIAGSLAGFRAENINLEYAAAFYATVTLADGSSFTVYTDFDYDANRSVGATIDAAVTAGSMTDTIANGLKALIAANKDD